jgi:hypothetical protein
MYLTDLISAKDMVRLRNTHPSEEWIAEQDRRLADIYKEYTALLLNEANRERWGDDYLSHALRHAMVAISSVDYIIYKVTEGPTQ